MTLQHKRVRRHRVKDPARFASAMILAALFAGAAFTQQLPDKILGYKVYQTSMTVAAAEPCTADVCVSVDKAEALDLGLSGVSFTLGATLRSAKISGDIDRVTFKDIKANGIKVNVTDYAAPFALRKGVNTPLPVPAQVTIPLSGLPRAAYDQLMTSPDQITVKGTAFVFGRFKRLGFRFKRVIPVPFEIRIANPLAVR